MTMDFKMQLLFVFISSLEKRFISIGGILSCQMLSNSVSGFFSTTVMVWGSRLQKYIAHCSEELLTVTEGMEAIFLSSFKRSLCVSVGVRAIQ